MNIKLNSFGAARISSGHPWVRRKDLNHFKDLPPAGSLVRLQDEGGNFLAHAFSEGATGELAYRVLSRERHPVLDRAWFEAACAAALKRRGALLREPEGACRLINGENDGLPGLYCDRFGDYLVVDVMAPGALFFTPWVEAALAAALAPKGILRKQRFLEAPAGASVKVTAKNQVQLQVVSGLAPEGPFFIREGAMRLKVDLMEGAHEGLFLDQRQNRALVAAHSKGLEVLNGFCYTSGFSVACLLAGAAKTVNVDLSAKALEWSKENLKANQLDPGAQEWHHAEVFEILAAWKKKSRRFGLIIQDPPPFSRNKHGVFQALKHYGRLATASLEVLQDGGFLAASCGVGELKARTFLRYLEEACQAAGVNARLVSQGSLGADFPFLDGFPEGKHQKFALIQVAARGVKGELTGLPTYDEIKVVAPAKAALKAAGPHRKPNFPGKKWAGKKPH